MYNITLIPGDGIGPEVSEATKCVINATGLDVNWETVNAGKKIFEDTGVLVPDKVFKSIEKNKIVLKGPITTPIGSGFSSINVMLRKKYDLYSNVRPVKSLPGIDSHFKEIDLVIFRENTEGLYAGVERELPDGSFEAIKRITRKASIRIAKSAFEYAKKNDKKKVTVVHKANIIKLTDGFFLNCVREVSKDYPEIELQEVIIDNMCMQLVMNPNQFEVIVTMNLYGDLLSDLCAGLVGGLGLVPGANMGKDISIFEAVHGSAPDIAGKNLANPIALILSSAMMLNHIGEKNKAEIIVKAVIKTIFEDRVLTQDLGGKATTTEITKAIIKNII